jgi:DNA-binding NarL/FixJ family response regulator
MNSTALEEKTIRLVLADDHQIIREGLKSIFQERNIEIVGEAADFKEIPEILKNKEADVVLLDINMPGGDACETTRKITSEHPDVKVLVLSMMDHEAYIKKIMDSGASGYILKSTGKEELIQGIKAVVKKQKFLCSEITFNLLNKIHNKPQPEKEDEKNPHGISKREMEVLQLIAKGLTTMEIADQLFTSKRTIETHRKNLLDKTNSKNTASLIRFAVVNGLIKE